MSHLQPKHLLTLFARTIQPLPGHFGIMLPLFNWAKLGAVWDACWWACKLGCKLGPASRAASRDFTSHACWVLGDVEGDAALKQEGRNGIMRICVPHLVCVEVMWVCSAEQ